MSEIYCEEVIISQLTRRGKGVNHSPIRVITEVFKKDGTLIAEYDPSPETFTVKDMVNFAFWMKENSFNPSETRVNDWLEQTKKQL